MVIIRNGLEFYVGFCLIVSYVLLDLLAFMTPRLGGPIDNLSTRGIHVAIERLKATK